MDSLALKPSPLNSMRLVASVLKYPDYTEEAQDSDAGKWQQVTAC